MQPKAPHKASKEDTSIQYARKVCYESRCETGWQDDYARSKFGYGLLIGVPNEAGPDTLICLASVEAAPGHADARLKQPVDLYADMIEVLEEEAKQGRSQAQPKTAPASVPVAPIRLDLEKLILHSLNALRMTPGCCYVLGVYTIEPQLSSLDSADFRQQVQVLQELATDLQDSKWLYGTVDDFDRSPKLLLNYSGLPDSPAMRCFNVPVAGDKRAAEEFLRQPEAALVELVRHRSVTWVSLETQLAEPFEFRCARNVDGSVSLEDNVWECIAQLSRRLASCRIFMAADAGLNLPGAKVLDYLRLQADRTDPIIRTTLGFEIEEPLKDCRLYGASRSNGFIRNMGEISSCIFAHEDNTMRDVERFMKNDLLRSISGRLRLLLDTYPELPDAMRLKVMKNLAPPRRAYFWPFVGSPIQFSEYLFKEEQVGVVVDNARTVFGVKVAPELVRTGREKFLRDRHSKAPKSNQLKQKGPQQSLEVPGLLRHSNICCRLAIGAAVIGLGLAFAIHRLLAAYIEDETLSRELFGAGR